VIWKYDCLIDDDKRSCLKIVLEKYVASKKVKVVIFGYSNIGYICLNFLLRKNVDVAMVVTHKDSNKEQIWFKSVYDLAKKNNIPVYTPSDPNTKSFVNIIKKANPDIIFSCYYRNMLSSEIISIPRLGAFNLHGSLLPQYRGRCPINWVLIHGQKKTGLTIHHMLKTPDSGNIVVQKSVPIKSSDIALNLHNRMLKVIPQVLSQFFALVSRNELAGIPQDKAHASYFGGRKPDDGKILWTQTSRDVYNLVRAVTHPYPGAYTSYKGKRIYVWWGKSVYSSRSGVPGTIAKIDAKGVRVWTGKGLFIIKRAQIGNGKEGDAFTVFSKEQIGTGDSLE